MPSRSADRKSLVSAKESPGPPGPNEVNAITQLSSSSTQVSRGSSRPQASCRRVGSGASSGSSSTTQLETPFCDLATVR